MINKSLKIFHILIFLLTSGAIAMNCQLAECADTADTGVDTLRKQVEKCWNAKMENDWAAVYDMFDSSFKEKLDKASFLGRPKISLSQYEIVDIQVVEPNSKGIATINYKVNQMGFAFDMKTKEEWIVENGEWKKVFKPLMQ